MKTTLDLPDDLIRELKLRSVYERRKLKDVAATALRRGLGAEESAAPHPVQLPDGLSLNKDGFPVFRCRPNAPATHTPPERLIDLEQQIIEEEDLRRTGIAR